MSDYTVLMMGPNLHLQATIHLDGRRKSWTIHTSLEPLPEFTAEPIEVEMRLSATSRETLPQHGDVTILATKAVYVLTESPEGSGILTNEDSETKLYLFPLSD